MKKMVWNVWAPLKVKFFVGEPVANAWMTKFWPLSALQKKSHNQLTTFLFIPNAHKRFGASSRNG
jgi:hypothetical protein